MRGLVGKSVLVTGGASGIGLATALRFQDEGCRVVVLDRDRPAMDRVAEEHRNVSGFVEVDVSDPNDVVRAFDSCADLVGPPDVVVNNAGIAAATTSLRSHTTSGGRS